MFQVMMLGFMFLPENSMVVSMKFNNWKGKLYIDRHEIHFKYLVKNTFRLITISDIWNKLVLMIEKWFTYVFFDIRSVAEIFP